MRGHVQFKVYASVAAAVLVAGCANGPRAVYDDPWGNPGKLPPVRTPHVQGQTNRVAPPVYDVPTYEAPVDAAPAPRLPDTSAEVTRLRERLERVERAMLRLDRRMQLVERNELGRMHDDGQVSNLDGGETMAMLNAPAAGAPTYGNGFESVAAAGPITSTLQAAPRGEHGFRRVAQAPVQVASAGLPSLADRAGGGTSAADSLAIWTVRYAGGTVWPAREQLPGSRDVADALRSPTPPTIFARGAKPQSVEFRERVKALSRYLAKVSGQDTVAISALAAPHLDTDTIEIFATPQ